jgi:hypothetical protein
MTAPRGAHAGAAIGQRVYAIEDLVAQPRPRADSARASSKRWTFPCEEPRSPERTRGLMTGRLEDPFAKPDGVAGEYGIGKCSGDGK